MKLQEAISIAERQALLQVAAMAERYKATATRPGLMVVQCTPHDWERWFAYGRGGPTVSATIARIEGWEPPRWMEISHLGQTTEGPTMRLSLRMLAVAIVRTGLNDEQVDLWFDAIRSFVGTVIDTYDPAVPYDQRVLEAVVDTVSTMAGDTLARVHGALVEGLEVAAGSQQLFAPHENPTTPRWSTPLAELRTTLWNPPMEDTHDDPR